MPEMDGYAATSQLRQRGYTRPIVALTANAMRGDEEKCLRAGCSAYLTKPVDRNQLATVLSQFLQPSEASSTGSMYSGVPDPAFQSLVREYVAGLSATRVQMAQAFAAGDLKQLASLAHQVKGAAGMYGFAELGESAGLIESACRENQETDLIGELLNEFDDLIRLARHLTGQTDKREEKE
jgi:HPt (histidine-containing phosphotransfer) domain-containing protein